MFFSPYRQDPPISRISRDEAGQPFGITGFFGEVIQLLQEGMNCTSVNRITRRLLTIYLVVIIVPVDGSIA